MRTRTANVHREAHGRALRAYDWIAPAGTDPHDAAVKAEQALGCKLWHRGDGEQHGYVTTRVLVDGSLHVCVVLYEACDAPDCAAGHAGLRLARHADPTPAQLGAMKAAVGEHRQHDVTRSAVRRALGVD